MASFESIFPTFLQKCAELHDLLLVVAYMLFIVGVMLCVAHGVTPRRITMFMVRLVILTALLVFLPQWGNQTQTLVQTSILDGLGVNPADVQDQYNQLLVVKRDTGADRSWWDILSDVGGFTVELLISGLLMLLGQIASFLMYWAYVFQKVILHLGYALSPMLIGFMSIQALRGIGVRYLLNLFGVLLWPLGWAVAALVTQGILDFMTDPAFKFFDPTATLYSLQATFGVAVLAFWILFSTVSAPIIIQKVLTDGALAGSQLIAGAIGGVIQTAATTAGTAAVASGIGMPAVTAGAAGLTAVLTTASTAAGMGSAGAIISAGSGLPSRGARGRSSDDITGDHAVRQLIARHKTPYS